MSANVVINNGTQNQSSTNSSNPFDRILKLVIRLVIIALVVSLVIAAYLIIDNWSYIVTFFTTGFIGWLNPFDDPDGDRGPLAVATDEDGYLSNLPVVGPVFRGVGVLFGD